MSIKSNECVYGLHYLYLELKLNFELKHKTAREREKKKTEQKIEDNKRWEVGDHREKCKKCVKLIKHFIPNKYEQIEKRNQKDSTTNSTTKASNKKKWVRERKNALWRCDQHTFINLQFTWIRFML